MIAIAMPTYNRVEYLAEAIESIIAQEYTDWKLCIVDDGSTDSTVELLSWYDHEYENISFISTKNQGIAAARNTAIAMCRPADYIAVMDSDDIMSPERLKVSLKEISKKSKGALPDFVYTSFLQADANAKVFSGVMAPKKFTKEDLLVNQGPPHVTIMARAACFYDHPYRSNLKVNDDAALLVDWYKAGYVGKAIEEPLMIVRYHSSSTSVTRDEEIKEVDAMLKKELENA